VYVTRRTRRLVRSWIRQHLPRKQDSDCRRKPTSATPTRVYRTNTNCLKLSELAWLTDARPISGCLWTFDEQLSARQLHINPHTLMDTPKHRHPSGCCTLYIYDEQLLSVTVESRQNPTILILRVAQAAKTYIMCNWLADNFSFDCL